MTPFQKVAVHIALRSLTPGETAQVVRDYLRTYPQDAARIADAVREAATELEITLP